MKINAGLHATRDALAVVKSWVETGQGEADAKRKLREGLDGLALLSELLASQGRTLPPELVEGLSVARVALGGVP